VISRLDCRDIGGRAASGRPLAGFVDHTRKTPVDRPGSQRALSLQLKALINSEAAKHPFRNVVRAFLNDCHLSTPWVKDADQLHMGSNHRLAQICQSSCGITDATGRVIDGRRLRARNRARLEEP